MIYKGKRITIIGLARSGTSAALLLTKEGASVFGSDIGVPAPTFINQLKQNNIDFEINGHTDRVFNSDIMVVSPGVPLKSAIITEAVEKGIKIIGELELASSLTAADLIAVTGSNGKSTTVSLLGKIFKEAASIKSRIGGNIGYPLSAEIKGLDRGDVLIAEVSSFQLDAIETFRPKSAVILNLTPDHLDIYDSVNDYYNSKLNITINQQPSDLLFLNCDDEVTQSIRNRIKTAATIGGFSLLKEVNIGAFLKGNTIFIRDGYTEKAIISVDEIKIPGTHNIANVLAALAVTIPFKLSYGLVAEAIKSFSGIEHRIEWVREFKGSHYWNDSKATNIDSVFVALNALKAPIHLIAGGKDKGGNFSSLNDLIRKKVKTVYAIGKAAPTIETAWGNITEVVMAENMENAVNKASTNASPHSNILLSPGCASFDQYKNYEERGIHFKKLVGEL